MCLKSQDDELYQTSYSECYEHFLLDDFFFDPTIFGSDFCRIEHGSYVNHLLKAKDAEVFTNICDSSFLSTKHI